MGQARSTRLRRPQFNLLFCHRTPPLEDQISHIVAPRVDYAPTTSKLLVEDQDAAAFYFLLLPPTPSGIDSQQLPDPLSPVILFSYPLYY